MTEYADFSSIMAGNSIQEEDLKLSNGVVVRVKGLTRYEYTLTLKISNTSGGVDMSTLERSLVMYGMVTPKLDKKQTEEWYKVAPAGIMDPIIDCIRRLSGLKDDADKSEVS